MQRPGGYVAYVRTRCAAPVQALLAGADPRRSNKNGSTPMKLPTHNTGRGGSGSPASNEQAETIRPLELRGAPRDAGGALIR